MTRGVSSGVGQGRWGFLEAWPPQALGPVYDIMFGDAHVARVFLGADGWRLVVRRHDEIGSDLESFLAVLNLVRQQLTAFEADRPDAPGAPPRLFAGAFETA